MRAPQPLAVWGGAAALVLAISVGLTIRQAALRGAAPDRFSGSRTIREMPSLLASPRLDARVRVVVVRDEAAAGFYDSPVLDSIVAAWRDAIAATGADVRVVRSTQLGGAARDVLVVPGAPCVSIATREAIERAGARGEGLIVSGPVGTHDAGCQPIGFGLVIALTGVSGGGRRS